MECERTLDLDRPPPWRILPVLPADGGAPADLWGRILRAIGEIPSALAKAGLYEHELALIRSMGSGDGDAAAEVYRRYSERIFRFVCRRVDEQTEDSEEITLDTFISAINLAGTYSGQSSVFTWLCGIAKLRIVDFHRRRVSTKRPPRQAAVTLDQLDEIKFHARFAQDSVEDVLDQIVASQVIGAALSRLTVDERESLLLRYVDRLSVREISVLMNRSEKAVESLLTRAKAKPRKFLLRLMVKEGQHD
jgi:RNA polymerase sigma-70 factor (ECF subfamily)